MDINRRRFLETCAVGLGAALTSRGLDASAVGRQAAATRASARRVLRDSDLQYLGAMRVPTSGVRLDFSYGQITGRRVNGEVRLIMVGNVVLHDPVFELADTGAYSEDPAAAPRMKLVRAWGDIYGNSRKTWDAAGKEREVYAQYPGAVHWNEATQLLYWCYYSTYNVSGFEDWCLGATRLDESGPVAYGPWRPAGDGRKGPYRCIRVTEHPTGAMLCGAGMMSGNSRVPWGPDMWMGAFPKESTPAGPKAPDLPVTKYLTYYPMIGRISDDGRPNGPIRSCRRPGDYFFEPIKGGTRTQIDPEKNNGVGSWTELDKPGDAVWIDLPDVHGVVFTGMLAAGHVWYSNAGNGNLNCTHGMPPPVAITGPVCTDAYPVMMIYDPADLDAVRAGAKADYTVDPVQIINAQKKWGVKTRDIHGVGSAKSIVGTYFDAPSRKLYVAAPEADTTVEGIWNPLVHVWKIA